MVIILILFIHVHNFSPLDNTHNTHLAILSCTCSRTLHLPTNLNVDIPHEMVTKVVTDIHFFNGTVLQQNGGNRVTKMEVSPKYSLCLHTQ